MNFRRLPIFAVLALIILMVVHSGSCLTHKSGKMPKSLWNTCSKKFVSLNGKKPAAKETDLSHASLFVSALDGRGTVVIQSSVVPKRYLCFDHRGRQKLKKGSKSPLCKFREIPVSGYITYESKENTNWTLAFDEAGNPLKGDKRQRCKRFLLSQPTPTPTTTPKPHMSHVDKLREQLERDHAEKIRLTFAKQIVRPVHQQRLQEELDELKGQEPPLTLEAKTPTLTVQKGEDNSEEKRRHRLVKQVGTDPRQSRTRKDSASKRKRPGNNPKRDQR